LYEIVKSLLLYYVIMQYMHSSYKNRRCLPFDCNCSGIYFICNQL